MATIDEMFWEWLFRQTQPTPAVVLNGVQQGSSIVDLGGVGSGMVVYSDWSPGVSAGQIVIETARSKDYAGTWANLATINFGTGVTKVNAIVGAYRAVKARISSVLHGTIPAAVFTGAGLNDLTSGGVYVLAPDALFEVAIDANGAPDTFKWRKNGGAYTAGVPASAGAHTLSDGVTVTFAAAVGHTIGDAWAISVLGGRVTVDIVRN